MFPDQSPDVGEATDMSGELTDEEDRSSAEKPGIREFIPIFWPFRMFYC